MARRQLRTVKKSHQTGRLDREAVRAAVILVRDRRNAAADAGAGESPNQQNAGSGTGE